MNKMTFIQFDKAIDLVIKECKVSDTVAINVVKEITRIFELEPTITEDEFVAALILAFTEEE